MRAAVVPAINTRWEVREVPTPEPGPNQVLINIHASGLCYTDIHQAKGELPGTFPRILGHEPVGQIVEVGPGVTTRHSGDRVGVPWLQSSCGRCEWCVRGKRMFCMQQFGTSGEMQGGHAEFMLAYADSTVLLPEGLPYEQAAPIFCAGYTVWSGLRWSDPQPHERIAVVGIGGLGHLAVQYAKAAGFTTIAISRSPDKDKFIRQLGADEIVRDGQGLAAIGGADVILGTSNSNDVMTDSIEGLRPDGRFVLMGFEAKPFQLSPGSFILKRLRIIGSQQNGTEFLYEALDYAAKGRVKVITETYPLNEIGRAYERVVEGKVRFRAVITN
ncbi:MAG: alcohol dehydrogenase catalytic domain-containing protein [Candidatus Methylomirabilales bacterium]